MGTLVGHPLDSLKVRAQTQERPTSVGTQVRAFSSSAAPLPTMQRSLSEALRQLRSLYAGVAAPLLTVGAVQAINFAIYDSSRRIMYRKNHPSSISVSMDYLTNDSLANVGTASVAAGCVLACFTAPLLIVKTKQQTQGLGFRQAVLSTMMPNGRWSLSSMYAGFAPHLLAETTGRAVYFCAYEGLKRHLAGDAPRSSVSLQERMLCAGTSGMICWTVIFPLDALRCRLFAQRGELRRSTLEMAQYMYAQGGTRAFYRGYTVTVARAGPVAAAVLPIYDLTLEYLSSVNS